MSRRATPDRRGAPPEPAAALSARLAQAGHVRLNGRRVDAAGRAVRVGDVLTIALERTVRVLEIVSLGARRGPAAEAQGLYQDVGAPGADDGTQA